MKSRDMAFIIGLAALAAEPRMRRDMLGRIAPERDQAEDRAKLSAAAAKRERKNARRLRSRNGAKS